MSTPSTVVIPISGDRPAAYGDAVEAYLRSAGIGASSKRSSLERVPAAR